MNATCSEAVEQARLALVAADVHVTAVYTAVTHDSRLAVILVAQVPGAPAYLRVEYFHLPEGEVVKFPELKRGRPAR